MWDDEAVRHVVAGPVVAGHGCRGRPGEIIVQHLSQNIVVGQSNIGESHIEAGNRTAIHFIVLPVPTVHLDHRGLVTIRIGIRGGTTESFGPISGEALDVLRVEAMAERMCQLRCHRLPRRPSACADDDNPFAPTQDAKAGAKTLTRSQADPTRRAAVECGAHRAVTTGIRCQGKSSDG